MFLGDFLHARVTEVFTRFIAWRGKHRAWRVRLVDIPFVFRHAPGASARGVTLAGHLLACFWLAAAGMVLPAFADFTGCLEIERGRGARV